jgi:hypothetical protein
MNEEKRDYNDLTTISGIGPVRQRWLQESLNVSTFRGLAALSVERATEQLKADGFNIPPSLLEEWIAAAKKILQEAPDSPKSEWQPFAAFVIEFQSRIIANEIVEQRTAAHYMEGDKEQKWPGLEGVELCRWILGNLGEQIPEETAAGVEPEKPEVFGSEKDMPDIEPSSGEEPSAVTPAEPEEADPDAIRQSIPRKTPVIKVSVQKLRISQSPHTLGTLTAGLKNEPFSGEILGGAPFKLEALFALVEMPNDNGLEKYDYHAEFYARDLSGGKNQFLGDSERLSLSSDESNYVAMLPEVVLPAGAYRLDVLVTVETTPAARGHLTAPLLYVA